MSHPQSARFLAAIATGQFDDHYFCYEFGRFGLQHILAISGFHFGIIALILNAFFRAIFPFKIATTLLILTLTAYFFLIGPRPSVIRAWIMISLALLGQLMGKSTNSLNLMGIALIIIVIIAPYQIFELGFHMSFAITASIILFFKPLDETLQKIYPHKRPLATVLQMPIKDQHGYLLLSFIRKSCALTLSVSLVAVPLTLFYFQQFPLLSLVYNLFFPLLTAISVFLLLTSFLLFPFPWLQNVIDSLNDRFTLSLINLTHYLPLSLDYTLYAPHITREQLICFLCFLFFSGMILHHRYNHLKNTIFA